MRRRDFIKGVAGSATAWPLATRAQQTGKLPTIGLLGPNALIWTPFTTAFVERLRQLGWVEDRTIAIEYRWTEGHPERVADLAAEFVRQKVDVIVTNGSSVTAIKRVTSVIPIVFAVAADPVGGGLVASLARPGGNTTGLSVEASDLATKKLELLREIVPRFRKLALMGNVGNPEAALETGAVETAARTLGLGVAPLEIRRPEDIAPAFEALKAQADALYVVFRENLCRRPVADVRTASSDRAR